MAGRVSAFVGQRPVYELGLNLVQTLCAKAFS
jgi:hypothetical protein